MSDIVNRLFSRTAIQENECWNFTGFHTPNGYGQIKYHGHSIGAHRLAYILCINDIPDGMLVCHTCDNRSCVNPEHLFLGTYQDNKDDCMAKDRHAYGPKIGISRVNEYQVREIRELLAQGSSMNSIAKRFNIGKTTVGHIRDGRTWRHV